MTGTIRQWLEGLDLGRYADAFEANQLDMSHLVDLSEDDLKELGVAAMGHRKTLLRAIAAIAENDVPIADATPTATAPQSAEAERRHLTVMFCDLVGSTALSERLDPEDFRDIMRLYQETCAAVVARFDGYLAKFLGDGVLVYFGYPRAHEDDAERAIRASLKIVEELEKLQHQDAPGLQTRIGIATGLVVAGDLVGEGVSETRAISGETPNLAARLQTLAEPGTVVVSKSTRQLARGLFEFTDLGHRRLKGIVEPVELWRVDSDKTIESRFEAIHARTLTPFIGREHETALLVERWEQAKSGEGQVVLLSGEAGIGKSRIVQMLRDRIADENHTRLQYQCSAHYSSTALYPFIGQLERAAGFEPEDVAEAKLKKIERLLALSTDTPTETVALIAALLSVPVAGQYAPLELTPQRQKEMTLAILADQLLGLATRQPVLMIVEDAHWVDPTTVEALERMLQAIERARVLIVITFRPDFAPPWHRHSHVTSLTLNRMSRNQCETMVESLAPGKPLPPEILSQLLAKTDGVPLFVEELTKTILGSGLLRDAGDRYELSGALPHLAIPSTLQDSLMARLDRLAQVKDVAQLGAAIGREFPYRLLAAVSTLPEGELHAALDQLVQSELLFRRGTNPEATYFFKHALLQDAAYEAMLRSRRQELHLQIAMALEERFPETREAHPEILAHHYTEADLREPAIDYWQRAGELALKRSANLEAIAHCKRGLDLISALPKSEALARQELAMQVTIGVPLVATKGYGAPEAATHYQRARELCELLGDTRQLLPVIYGQWLDSAARGEYGRARAFGEELLEYAAAEDDPAAMAVGHRTIAWIDLFRADFELARSHIDEGLAHYEEGRLHAVAVQYAHDTKVTLLTCRACLEWLTGFPQHALESGKSAIAHAREINHAASLAYALCYGGAAPVALRREPEAVAAAADELIELSEAQAFPLRLTIGKLFKGWSLTYLDCPKEGTSMVQTALTDLERARQDYAGTLYMGLAADAFIAAEQWDLAELALKNAFALMERSGERWWEPELHRLRGVCREKAPGRDNGAENWYRSALQVAQVQGAKGLQLRTATNLSYLLRKRTKLQEARDILVPLHDWFTEGDDTPDLKAAEAQLAELS
jgi:predicted ATPase/class 3 adenylate cyclase